MHIRKPLLIAFLVLASCGTDSAPAASTEITNAHLSSSGVLSIDGLHDEQLASWPIDSATIDSKTTVTHHVQATTLDICFRCEDPSSGCTHCRCERIECP